MQEEKFNKQDGNLDQPNVNGWAGVAVKTKGTDFVEHYPSMFTEDTEWWAQKLDEHFERGILMAKIAKLENEIEEMRIRADEKCGCSDPGCPCNGIKKGTL